MQSSSSIIGLFHPHNFNRSLIVHFLRSILVNEIVKINLWEEIESCNCSILIIIEPEILSSQLSERHVKKKIYSIDKHIIIVPFHEQKRIETTKSISVLKHNVKVEELIEELRRIENQIIN